jgi:hypothetical protein
MYIFSAKSQKMLLELDLAKADRCLLEALPKMHRLFEARIEESTALLEKVLEASLEVQLI